MMDAEANINMINGGVVYSVPITSCVPIPYIDRIEAKERYKEPETTKAMVMLREIDQLFVFEIEEAYLGDSKFQRPLAHCFLSRESWAQFCKSVRRQADDKDGNLLLTPEEETQFKTDLLAGKYKCVMLDHNHRSLAQKNAWQRTIARLNALGEHARPVDNDLKRKLEAKAAQLAMINLNIFAGTQRTNIEELVEVNATINFLPPNHFVLSWADRCQKQLP
jgi:hypothetical protein